MKDIRKLILEAVETGGDLTVEDVREYVTHWWDNPVKPSNQAIGQHLRVLALDGKLDVENNHIRLPNRKPSAMVSANPTTETTEIAPFQRKRSGRMISIEHSPMEIEDVARMEVKIAGNWIPILLASDVRVCIGPTTPKWHPAQETLSNVAALRITTKAGKVEEMNINPDLPVTLAPVG